MEAEGSASTSQADVILSALSRLVGSLQSAVGPSCEVLLRDLTEDQKPILAIAGSLTNRHVGDPAGGLLYDWLSQRDPSDRLNYSLATSDGRIVRASTLFVRDGAGRTIGCLSVNIDITAPTHFSIWNTAYCSTTPSALTLESSSLFSQLLPIEEDNQDFASLVEKTIEEAIGHSGMGPSRMKKKQRLDVIHELDRKGVFLVKNAKELLATRLGVSQAAVYKYLDEVRRTRIDQG